MTGPGPQSRAPTDALIGVLDRGLRERGLPGCVGELRRRPSAYATSFPIENLSVDLDDGSSLQVVFKDLDRTALTPGARAAKPAFLHDPEREIAVYRLLLDPAALGTARCFAWEIDAAAGRHWLFLEKVPGVELYQIGELSTWAAVSSWLAGMHGRLGRAAEGSQLDRRLLRYDDGFYRTWVERACARAGTSGERTRLRWVRARYDGIVERLLSLPTTTIHGEFYASNVLVSLGKRLRVCPVDWEMAAIGPGLVDLAALSSGNWTPAQREQLAAAYHASLDPGPVGTVVPFETLLGDLDRCRVHLCMQWLGWSADWEPPPEHRHPWLDEAVELVERLEAG